jgi:hypothetical protein
VFNSRLNEYSLAPQFKWLEYTFKYTVQLNCNKTHLCQVDGLDNPGDLVHKRDGTGDVVQHRAVPATTLTMKCKKINTTKCKVHDVVDPE